MKKILALCLALLMVMSVALTACTPGTTKETGTEKGSDTSTTAPEESKPTESTPDSESKSESNSESNSESKSESTSESGSDEEPAPALPTLADGVISVTARVPVVKISQTAVKEGESSTTVTTLRLLYVEFSYDRTNNTFYLCVSGKLDGEGTEITTYDMDPVIFSAYYDGTYLYMEIEGTKAATTPKVLLESVLNQLSLVMDDKTLDMLAGYIEKMLNGDISGLPTTPDFDTLLGMLPEEYRDLVRQILDLLPEGGVEIPDVTLPEIKPEQLIGALMKLFDKVESESGKGGDAYKFDFSKITGALTGVLDQIPALFEMTPAAYIDKLAGKEGTYNQVFLLLSTSIKGDTSVGSILDNLFLVLNAQGCRITDEKIVKLVETVITLATGKAPEEGYVAELYAQFRKMTLDELLAAFKNDSTDTPLTVAKIMETINTFMTESTFGDLVDMLGEGMSDKVLATVAKIKDVITKVTGSFSFCVNENNELYGICFDLYYDGKTLVFIDLTIDKTWSVTPPEFIPKLDRITVTEKENGDLVIGGLGDGDTIEISVDGNWTLRAGGEDLHGSFSQDFNKKDYVSMDTVRLSDLKNLPIAVFEDLAKTTPLPDGAEFKYEISITISVTLEDGTSYLLYPVYSESGTITDISTNN